MRSREPPKGIMRMLGQKMVKRVADGLLILLWLSTAVIGVSWLLGRDLPFDPGPMTFVLGVSSSAITAVRGSLINLLKERQEELEIERISTSYALAYGYVHNFVEPVITTLLRKTKPGEGKVEFYIYIPEELSELQPSSIERTLAKIREKNYSTVPVHMEFAEGRARDVMTVLKEQERDAKYFDFPHTLLTLTKMIDFQVEKKDGSRDERAKIDLGRRYIEQFKIEVQKLIDQQGLSGCVKFTDKNLNLLEQE
jgi:hypothetical protein